MCSVKRLDLPGLYKWFLFLYEGSTDWRCDDEEDGWNWRQKKMKIKIN